MHKNAAHPHEYRVRSVRPTWFEDWKMPPKQEAAEDPNTFQPMHGLKLVIKEDVLPQEQWPNDYKGGPHCVSKKYADFRYQK